MDKNIAFSLGYDDRAITVHFGGYPDTSSPRLHAKDSGFLFEYIMSGEMTVESPDILLHAGIGDLLIIHPSSECVLYRRSGELKTVGFSISGFVFEAISDVFALPSVFCSTADVFAKVIDVDKTFEKYSLGDGDSGRAFCELAFSLMLDAVSALKRGDPFGKPSAEAIRDYLDLCLCGEVDLDTVGKKFGISGMHVIRLFRAKYDETPMFYLKTSRLEKSAELLRSTDMSIKEISSLLQFSSTQHFTNLFREHFGISPGKYRETNK